MSHVAAGQPEELHPDIAALAARSELGGHRATYLPRRLGNGWVAAMIVMIVAGLFLVIPGIYFLVFMLRSARFSKTAAAKRVHFFEHGMLVVDPTRPVDVFRWDTMSVLQEIINQNGQLLYTYTLTRPDQTTVKLTNFYEHPRLWGHIIQQEITNAQLPPALAAGERGQPLQFGDITLTVHGVATAKRAMVAWHDIQELSVRNGWVFLRKAGKTLSWSSTPIAKIPNFFLFLALVDHYRGQSASALPPR